MLTVTRNREHAKRKQDQREKDPNPRKPIDDQSSTTNDAEPSEMLMHPSTDIGATSMDETVKSKYEGGDSDDDKD